MTKRNDEHRDVEAREKMVRRLIKARRLLGETWRTHPYPRLAERIRVTCKDEMHTVLRGTATCMEIAALEFSHNYGYRLIITSMGPKTSRSYPGELPRMAMHAAVYFNGLEVETAFEEVYRTALKMWKAGAKARADHNDFKKP